MISAWWQRARRAKRPPTAMKPLPFIDPLGHLSTEEMSEQLARDYAYLFNQERGARVLGDILHRAGVFGAYPYGLPRDERDRIDGQRELALSIAAAAGFELERMPRAAMQDDLRQASKGDADERHGNDDEHGYDHNGSGNDGGSSTIILE